MSYSRAEQALAYLEIQRYDVVFTDIAMPGPGGVEILTANHTFVVFQQNML
jgi:CheY-like chemotaxis protein